MTEYRERFVRVIRWVMLRELLRSDATLDDVAKRTASSPTKWEALLTGEQKLSSLSALSDFFLALGAELDFDISDRRVRLSVRRFAEIFPVRGGARPIHTDTALYRLAA